MEGIYCDNTDEMLLMNTIKCPRLAESSVIHTAQQQSADEPFVFTEIKSTTIEVSVASNRDFHYFDKMGMVRQRSRKRMAYHVMQSVDLPEIPQKPTYKRVKASLCYLFEELEDDLVGVYMQGSTNYTALSYFARIAVSDVLLAQLDNALDCTRAKKLALIMSMNCLDVSQQKSCRKKTCYVCKGKPFFERLTTCAGCMEYVCKKCRFNEHVLARDTRLGSHLKRAVFCSVCISKVDLSSLNQIRATAHEDEVPQQVNATQSATSSESEEKSEDGDTRSSQRLLTTFVHSVSIQMQELNTGSDERASNMTSMGKTDGDLDIEKDDEDINLSGLTSNPFLVTDQIPTEVLHRNSSATFRSSASFDHEDDVGFYPPALLTKLEQLQ